MLNLINFQYREWVRATLQYLKKHFKIRPFEIFCFF